MKFLATLPLSPDATEQSWRGPAVRRRSWAEGSPCSRGSPTSPSTVREQGPPGEYGRNSGVSSEEPGQPSACLAASVTPMPGSWSANEGRRLPAQAGSGHAGPGSHLSHGQSCGGGSSEVPPILSSPKEELRQRPFA